MPSTQHLPPPYYTPAVLSVVDMDDSRLSMELLLVACKLLKLALRGLPETVGLAVELDIISREPL